MSDIEPRKLRIRIEPDPDVENPCDWDCQWKLYSFNRRHASFEHPDRFFHDRDKPKWGFANKLRAGTAFVLGYFEHGNCQWALRGEQH